MSSCPIIGKNIDKSEIKKKTVRELVEQLKYPKPPYTKITPRRSEINIEFIKLQLKKKWKDPGFGNVEFIKAPVLRGKLLNEWQLERISLAERSYKFPKGCKGYRFDGHSRKFPIPGSNLLSPQFTRYFSKLTARIDQKLIPDPTISERGQRIKRMMTQNSIKASSSKQYHKTGFFGYSFRDKCKNYQL